MKKLALLLVSLLTVPLSAQWGTAVSIRSGTVDPANCQPRSTNVFINRNSTPVLKICSSTNTWTAVGAGTGDVVGPASATDLAAAVFDGATGKLLKNSLLRIDSSGRLLIGASAVLRAGTNDIGYEDGAGPYWQDNSGAGFKVQHNIQSLTADRTVVWPDLAGTVVVGSATGTTVGAAGAGDALPLTPLGYLTVKLPSGASVKIPYYNP